MEVVQSAMWSLRRAWSTMYSQHYSFYKPDFLTLSQLMLQETKFDRTRLRVARLIRSIIETGILTGKFQYDCILISILTRPKQRCLP